MHEPAGQPRDCSLEVSDVSADLVERADAVARSSFGLPGRVQLVQMPAEPANSSGPFCEKGFVMIGEQAYLAVWSIPASGRKVRFSLRCAGDGERVDRVRFAVGSR